MNRNLFLITIVVVVALVVGILIGKYALTGSLTGNIVSDNKAGGGYSWTTAICDDENRCIDVLVECENGNVKSLKPASNLMEFGDNWSDSRDGNGNYCD